MSEIEYVVSFGEHPDIDDCGALREKVVRCRDCAKWHYFDYKDGVRYGGCDEWKRADSYLVPATREDGFCYWGERREVSE